MTNRLPLSTLDAAILWIHTFVLGGCLVLLALGRVGDPLILLTIGSALVVIAKIGQVIIRKRKNHEAGADS